MPKPQITDQTPEPTRLSLHVPEPAVRPGDEPDFSHIEIPRAGAIRCPPIDVEPADIKDLAYSIVRVMNRNGEAVGPWAEFIGADLNDGLLIKGLRDMITTRSFDARMTLAQRQGKTSFYMQCTGEEAVACAFQAALRPGT